MVREISGLQKNVERRHAGVICYVDAGNSSRLDERAISGQFFDPFTRQFNGLFNGSLFYGWELRWQYASQIWREKHLPQEEVLDYVVRVKKLARELNFQPEIVQMIILQGFRPGIKAAVIQKGRFDMDEMIYVAKLA
jgi:hypothetical protein